MLVMIKCSGGYNDHLVVMMIMIIAMMLLHRDFFAEKFTIFLKYLLTGQLKVERFSEFNLNKCKYENDKNDTDGGKLIMVTVEDGDETC